MRKELALFHLALALGTPTLLTAGDIEAQTPTSVEKGTSRVSSPDSRRSSFTGLYAGVDVGSQNVFSGALIDGIDVLTQDTRTVIDLSLGWSREVMNRFVVGAEIRYGFLKGDLTLSILQDQATIHYANDSQLGYRLIAGWVVGRQRELLVYGYFGETQRDFDILIAASGARFGQRDRQAGERFGLGVEKHLARGWSLRATAGTLSTDFGGLMTNISIDEDVAFAVGLTYRFRRSR